MAKEKWVSKRDMTLAGVKVNVGQIVQPAGSINDHIIFQERSQWVAQYTGDSIPCGTDGCPLEFNNLGNLERHRNLVHKPERDERAMAQAQAAKDLREAEARGEAIGGHPITKVKKGPGGDVPYIEMAR